VPCLEQRDDLRSATAKLLIDLPRCGRATDVLTMLADPAVDALTARPSTPGQRSAALGSLSQWALDVEVAVERLARVVERRSGWAVRKSRGVARP
jgi:hypothetical protein